LFLLGTPGITPSMKISHSTRATSINTHGALLATMLLGPVLGACSADAGTGEELQSSESALTGASVQNTALSTLQPNVAVASSVVARLPKFPLICPPPDGTRPDPTLVNTDSFVLSRFGMDRVFQQLVNLAGIGTATALYQQLWDTLDLKANAKFNGAHCNDATPPSINGFRIACPRFESTLKNSLPTVFEPVALFNRFDLAPADGTHCGEYRIVYALKPGRGGRNFVIFEGILPNPKPECGIEACRPVVKFWENLASHDPTTAAGQQALADGLEAFYFKGLPGFEPVVHPGHYGMTPGSGYGAKGKGQVRTNMFMGGNWLLREHVLTKRCKPLPCPILEPVTTASASPILTSAPLVPPPSCGQFCDLLFQPVTVKNNPFHEMFDVLNPAPDARAPAFRATFPAQTVPLSSSNVNEISMATDDRHNAGQSMAIFTEDYALQLGLHGLPNAFSAAIDAQISGAGIAAMNATHVARRASTQSCAGCHQLSNGVALGGTSNPIWPLSRGFVHVDESGFLSPALWCQFLPFRKKILDAFAASPPLLCGSLQVRPAEVLRILPVVAPTGIDPAQLTISGKMPGAN
jgi:hypothetical protein